jgi:hypothetical protein
VSGGRATGHQEVLPGIPQKGDLLRDPLFTQQKVVLSHLCPCAVAVRWQVAGKWYVFKGRKACKRG